MTHCVVADEPTIEDDAVVLRIIHEDPAVEDSGSVFVCRMTGFDEMTIETFPKGQTPSSEGEKRAQAAAAAKAYAEANLDRFEELFEELARRRAGRSD